MNSLGACILIGFSCLIVGYWIGRMQGRTVADKVTNIQSARQLMSRLSSEGRGKVEEAYRAGRKIEAIKLFRSDTNTGLRDAKQSVELMILEERLRQDAD